MKRYIHAARTVNKGFKHRLNYEAVDAVMQEVEEAISKIESYDDIEIDLNASYNSFSGVFIVDCNLAPGSVLTTPDGNVIEVQKEE